MRDRVNSVLVLYSVLLGLYKHRYTHTALMKPCGEVSQDRHGGCGVRPWRGGLL